MTDLLEGLFRLIGEILKLLWLPMIVVMLISVVATPALRHLPIRAELRQPLQRFFRIAAFASTALVLLAFVLLFGSLWLIGKQNPAPPA
ncbi:MAG: hypothetical protein SGJ23_05815 [Alphaproteobacteria bacterium]|nr:hypothetical protein [Alphaproteobacteria bacterium]